MDGGVVDHGGADRIPCAAIDDEMIAQREDAAFVVEADVDIVDLVARVTGTHQMLAAVLDPLHRPSELAGQKRNQQIFRIDMTFDAEAAADVERKATHAGLGKLEHRGCLAPHPMHHLGGRPDRDRIRPGLVQADDAAALHGHGGVAVMLEAPLQAARRTRQRGIHIGLADREGANQVGAESIMDDCRTGTQRLLGIEDRRQRIEIERDQLGRVFSRVTALRQDDSDGLADMTDLVVGKERLLRIDELVLHQRGPLARQRELGVGHRRQLPDKLGAA